MAKGERKSEGKRAVSVASPRHHLARCAGRRWEMEGLGDATHALRRTMRPMRPTRSDSDTVTGSASVVGWPTRGETEALSHRSRWEKGDGRCQVSEGRSRGTSRAREGTHLMPTLTDPVPADLDGRRREREARNGSANVKGVGRGETRAPRQAARRSRANDRGMRRGG